MMFKDFFEKRKFQKIDEKRKNSEMLYKTEMRLLDFAI